MCIFWYIACWLWHTRASSGILRVGSDTRVRLLIYCMLAQTHVSVFWYITCWLRHTCPSSGILRVGSDTRVRLLVYCVLALTHACVFWYIAYCFWHTCASISIKKKLPISYYHTIGKISHQTSHLVNHPRRAKYAGHC